MKLEVFEYLIAIEKYGSYNKAAAHLYVSQPNLSNVIKSFEKEVGYSILYRNHQGVYFTDKGKQVLQIAHHILEEKNKLYQIDKNSQVIHLNISIGHADFVLEPLLSKINQQTLSDTLHMRILNLSPQDALEQLYAQTIDLAYFIIPITQEKEINTYCTTHHLQFDILKQCTCYIEVNKDHPFVQHFSKEALWNYPFVDYINQKQNVYGTYQQYINPHKIIEIDHHSLRRIIVQKTNAYAIGISNHENEEIKKFPLPDLQMYICECRKITDQKNSLFDEIKQTILKQF